MSGAAAGAAPAVTYKRSSEMGGARPDRPRDRDPVRQETRTRLRVRLQEARPDLAIHVAKKLTDLPGHGIVRLTEADRDGWIEATVYASDVPKILDMVEDSWDRWAQAVDVWRRNLRDRVAAKGATGAADAAQIERTDPGSPEAEFHRNVGRGLRPLDACEVLEENIPPPLSEKQQETALVVEGMARAFAGAGRGGDSAEVAELRAELAETQRALREFMAKFGEGPAPAAPAKTKTTKDGA